MLQGHRPPGRSAQGPGDGGGWCFLPQWRVGSHSRGEYSQRGQQQAGPAVPVPSTDWFETCPQTERATTGLWTSLDWNLRRCSGGFLSSSLFILCPSHSHVSLKKPPSEPEPSPGAPGDRCHPGQSLWRRGLVTIGCSVTLTGSWGTQAFG